MNSRNTTIFLVVSFVIFLTIVLTYSNHFHNDFHFDDSHTILTNPYIRNLGNFWLFFADARTSSTLPSNQTYRPLFTLSTAVDHALAGGLKPFFSHLSSFFWYLVQLVFMFFLFRSIFDRAYRHDWNKWLALFGVGWYGLHTANAETVNYISARSDLLSTLLLIIALVMYIYSPCSRRLYLYLIPFALGVLVKPAALMFAPLLFLFILFFEEKKLPAGILRAFFISLPAFILAVLLYLFQNGMTPSTFYPSIHPLFNYAISQPFVALYYFKTFFLPFGLSADYDWGPLATIFDPRFLIGSAFIIAMLILAWYFYRGEKTRPISFGILWFFIALLPSSSFFPLSEILNDHRIFFPFVGLTVSVVWAAGWGIYKYEEKIKAKAVLKAMILSACVLILLANALGTRHRNRIWKDEESLWYDVSIKSPRNGRGLMNYGLTQMAKGRYDVALKYYKEALKYTPTYSFLYINIGILEGATGRQKEAEYNFKKALEYGPGYYGSYYYYAEWLNKQGRRAEAIPLLERSSELSPGHLESKYLLLSIYESQNNKEKTAQIKRQILNIDPNDAIALKHHSPEYYLNLSLQYYQKGLFKKCISAAEEALKLRPNYAEAYNNIGAAYNSMGRWGEGIKALEKALALKPDFELAKNNLKWARENKR